MERSNSRLAKGEIGAFTEVNDPLEEKHHEEVGRYRQPLGYGEGDFNPLYQHAGSDNC